MSTCFVARDFRGTTLAEIAAQVRPLIERAESAGVVIDDGNIVDLIADNVYASIEDIRTAIVAAGLAQRFPRATAPAKFRANYEMYYDGLDNIRRHVNSGSFEE